MNRFFLQKVLHRIFTLFISLSGSFSLVFCVREALPDGIVKPLGITLLFITAIDIISLLVHDLFVSEKANGFTYIRYAIYLNIILFLIIKFCEPIVSTGLIWLGTNTAVVLTYVIKNMFDLYEKFTFHTTGMNGKDLSADLTENNWYVSDYINYAQKLIFSLFVISLVLSGFALILHIYKKSVSVKLYISLICFIAAYVGLIIVHTVNDHETSFAFLGHNSIFGFRSRIITMCVLICLISVGAGAIISSDTAVLSPDMFKWILKIFPGQEVPLEMTGYNQGAGDSDEYFEIDKDFYGVKEESLFTVIMHYFFMGLEYASIIAISAGIIWFLCSAFFGKKWKEFWKNKKLSAFLKKMWINLKKLIYDLLHMKFERAVYNTVEAARFKDTMKSLLAGSRKSKEKRAELDALTRQFMKLVDFGAANDISYKPHMAPLEFARLLKNDDALTAGRLFEQALYAKELLSKEERTQFEQSIEAAIR